MARDPRHRPAPDPYAAHRCGCGHIVYAGQTDGGTCLVCDCTDHRRPR